RGDHEQRDRSNRHGWSPLATEWLAALMMSCSLPSPSDHVCSYFSTRTLSRVMSPPRIGGVHHRVGPEAGHRPQDGRAGQPLPTEQLHERDVERPVFPAIALPDEDPHQDLLTIQLAHGYHPPLPSISTRPSIRPATQPPRQSAVVSR